MKPAYGFIEMAQQKRRTYSIRRKYIIFSIVLFLFTLAAGSGVFVFSMWRMQRRSAAREVSKTLDIERLRFEALVDAEIALVLKMADSPLIRRYFLSPENPTLERAAFEELSGYRRAFAGDTIFWINDRDRKFYSDGEYLRTVDADAPEDSWYRTTLYGAEQFTVDIEHTQDTGKITLWVNTRVFDGEHWPAGIVGTGIDLSNFLNSIYLNFSQGDSSGRDAGGNISGGKDTHSEKLYFFNGAGVITGAEDVRLVAEKAALEAELGADGAEILRQAKTLADRAILNFSAREGEAAIGAIPALSWYVAAIHPVTLAETLRTSQTTLFLTMMFIIAVILVISNLYVADLLKPLNRMVDALHKISAEWDIVKRLDGHEHDEIGILGEFINMTIIDPLTGIYNRRFMEGTIRRFIKTMSRTQGKLSFLMIDIDFFKNYNDTYGHSMGDECLGKIAACLAGCIAREDDFIARYGGEEFAVVLPNTDETGAGIIAERLLDAVRKCAIPHETSDAADIVTVSIGSTTATVAFAQSAEDYIKKADAALYISKRSGRNRYTFEGFEST